MKHSGRHINTNDDVTAALDLCLGVQDADLNKERMYRLHSHWTLCVNVGEDYKQLC